MVTIKERDFERELSFQASTSGGAGGQNVNKVATKVELRFHVEQSELLTEQEKLLIQQKLAKRINKDGYMQLVCQTARSQHKNKEQCVERFYELIGQALKKEKKRKATRPTKASVKRRLEGKQRQAQKKASRSSGADY